MLRSILCIRKTLNHVATDASTDINVSMIKIGQRQAELLLLRKMITKDIFQYCLVTLACCRFRGHEDKIVTKETEIGHGKTEVHERVQV